jgi:hypothetical protein
MNTGKEQIVRADTYLVNWHFPTRYEAPNLPLYYKEYRNSLNKLFIEEFNACFTVNDSHRC